MSAQTVICPACGWTTARHYQPADEFGAARVLHEGFGVCRKCATPMTRRARPVQGLSDRKAAAIRAELAQWEGR